MITVEGLGKDYWLGVTGKVSQHSTLRDEIAARLGRIVRQVKPGMNADGKGPHTPVTGAGTRFWALRDVSFAVGQGEVLGVVGRNGAGKSTLLKILGRITEPTEGRAKLTGRVASLLEVGTGFHPELTGRENIYLNGAILGMTRAEIRSRFDEIVAFSEVERFLDTPVKRYSSGMHVRLAFAVAAHLEPEILIIDEVLAVGDLGFQQKCLGKMHSVRRSGRTVLFVSHNMAAVQTLCDRAIYLKSGRVQAIGPAPDIVGQYLLDGRTQNSHGMFNPVEVAELTLSAFEVQPNPVASRGPLRFTVKIESRASARLSEAALLIHAIDGTRLAIVDLRPCGLPRSLSPGVGWTARGHIHDMPLVEGEYRFGLYLNSTNFKGNLHDLVTLTVMPARGVATTPYAAAHRGVVELDVTLEQAPSSPALIDRESDFLPRPL